MKKTHLICFVLITLSFAISAQSKKELLLNYDFELGSQYEMIFETKQIINASELTIPQNIGMVAICEILAVNAIDSTSLMKITYKKLWFIQDNPQEKIFYHSDSTQESTGESVRIAQAFGRLVDKWVTIRFKNNGEMVESVDGDELLMKVMMDQNNIFSKYPSKSIKIGESWTSEEKREINSLKFLMTSKNTLKSVKNGKVNFISEGILKDEHEKQVGTQYGTFELDEKDLMVMKCYIEQDIKDMLVMGLVMDLKSKTTITVTKK